MIQLPDLSIVKEKLILMVQASKRQVSFGYDVGSRGREFFLVSYAPTTKDNPIMGIHQVFYQPNHWRYL